ncbi:MAG: DUF4386 domain-containing protein [Actinomycetes bacterium]
MKNARITGIFYLITFVTSIPAVFLLGPVLHHPNFITGSGSSTSVLWGCLLDLLNAIACVGTAISIYPIVQNQNKSLALGFIASRLFEAAVIMIGVVSLLAIVSLRKSYLADHSMDAASLQVMGSGLLELRNWTFLLGPGLIPAVNGILLGSLLYKSKLIPRLLPTIGLIGAPMLVTSALCTYFGIFGQTSAVAAILGLPIAAWELSVGVYLTFRGVRII